MHAEREYWLKVLKIRDGQGKGTQDVNLILTMNI